MRGRAIIVAGFVATLAAVPAFPQADPTAVEIVTTNDIAAGNGVEDDLYSAAVLVSWPAGPVNVEFAEYMFTDRERGRRFDETWVAARGRARLPRRWSGSWSAGVVRVGRGLFGERVQNAIHDLIGSDTVELAYDPSPKWHPALTGEARRRVLRGQRALIYADLDASIAPGFRHHAEATVDATVALGRGFLASAVVGARWSGAEHDLLRPHVVTLGPTWEVGVSYRGRIRVSWSENRLGIGQRHMHVAFRLPGFAG